MGGFCLIVWMVDGKLKYQLHHDQEKAEVAVKRIRDTVPPNLWNVFFVASDSTLTVIKGEEEL